MTDETVPWILGSAERWSELVGVVGVVGAGAVLEVLSQQAVRVQAHSRAGGRFTSLLQDLRTGDLPRDRVIEVRVQDRDMGFGG